MTISLLELQTQAAAIEEKRGANTRALKATQEKSERARDFAIEAETDEARAGFRTALLEVESLELLAEELDRRAAFVAQQIEVAQREQDEQNARETLSARADEYTERRAQAFELRAQIAVAFEKIPALFDELVFLRCEADELSQSAKTLNDQRAGEFGADSNVLLWHSRDAIAGGLPGFAEPVQALFDAVAFNQSDTNRARLLEMQRAAGEPHDRDRQTDEQREAEAQALKRHQRGERDRDAVFAFQNWKHAQKDAEIDAENARVALQSPARSITTEQATNGRELAAR